MRKQIFNLMLGAMICSTGAAFGMEEDLSTASSPHVTVTPKIRTLQLIVLDIKKLDTLTVEDLKRPLSYINASYHGYIRTETGCNHNNVYYVDPEILQKTVTYLEKKIFPDTRLSEKLNIQEMPVVVDRSPALSEITYIFEGGEKTLANPWYGLVTDEETMQHTFEAQTLFFKRADSSLLK